MAKAQGQFSTMRVLLRHFLWYAKKGIGQAMPDLSQNGIYENSLTMLRVKPTAGGLTAMAQRRCQRLASYSTVHHYYATLRVFFNWCVGEGFLTQSPLAKIKIHNPKPKVIQPYSSRRNSENASCLRLRLPAQR